MCANFAGETANQPFAPVLSRPKTAEPFFIMGKDNKRDRDAEVVEETVEVVSSSDADDEAVRRAAKKARKAAKKAAKAAAGGVTSDGDEAELQQQEESEKKSKKKDKKEKSAGSVGSGLYVEHAVTTALTQAEVDEHRRELSITVSPEEDAARYKPITSFECLTPSLGNTCNYVTKYLKAKNFAKPSPIQSECWAPLLSGRDLVGIAATGSGKTLGFLIPGLLRMERLKASTGVQKVPGSKPSPKILIVAPTRELAMQSQQVVDEIGGPAGVCIYGGVPKEAQKAALRNGAEIVVATPGRLMDLIQENALSLAKVCYLVLDEADRM
jgi:ATP-dependent RNA helicase DBP3